MLVQLGSGILDVLQRNDLVAFGHGAGFMPGDEHRLGLRDTSFLHHHADAAPSEIVEQ